MAHLCDIYDLFAQFINLLTYLLTYSRLVVNIVEIRAEKPVESIYTMTK